MRNTFLVADPFCMRHLTGLGHPESPARYQAIDYVLSQSGLKTPASTLKPQKVSQETLELCHTRAYLDVVDEDIRLCRESGIVDGSYSLSTGDAQICPDSQEAALLSAGGALAGVDAVMSGKADNVFSYLRPPGHHACHDRGMGFCIYNNIAIAARYAQKKHGLGHVLIVDWDVHHGNGTQDIFDDDPSVFYLSTHQAGIYPGTGSPKDRGVGAAVGTKLNFPIQPGPASRKYVLEAFRGPLVESMKKFKPELVLISAGFDAHYSDPLGGFNLTEDDFGELTRIVMQLADAYADGRVVSLLEGGYNLEGLALSALAHVKTLQS